MIINPFEIDDLHNYIFSYLRKEPYLQCSKCKLVLEWDPKIIKNKYVQWENFIMCHKYYRESFVNNYYNYFQEI